MISAGLMHTSSVVLINRVRDKNSRAGDPPSELSPRYTPNQDDTTRTSEVDSSFRLALPLEVQHIEQPQDRRRSNWEARRRSTGVVDGGSAVLHTPIGQCHGPDERQTNNEERNAVLLALRKLEDHGKVK